MTKIQIVEEVLYCQEKYLVNPPIFNFQIDITSRFK